jgi:RecA-family ATPase
MSVHRGSNRFDDDDDERAKRGFDDNSFFDELRKKYPRVKITQKMKEDAVHMAQMHGGDWQDWLEEMVQKEQATIDNTKFNDDHLTTKNGYEHVATYKYTAPDGTVLFEALRYQHKLLPRAKKFMYRHWSALGWLNGQGWNTPGVIYRWHEVANRPNETVYHCEGEKDADRLASLGLLATTVPGQHWKEPAANAFRGKDVIVLEDNDNSGRKNVQVAVEQLIDLAKSVRVVRLPGLGHQGDVSEWLDAGHSKEELLAECANAPVEGLSEFFNVDGLDDVEVPAQQWSVPGHVPTDQVTLCSGHGAIGKSLLMLQLSVAHVLGKEWLGLTPTPGPVMFIDAEDSHAVIHKRLKDILTYYGARFSDLGGRLHARSLSGMDATLAVSTSKSGKIEPTALFRQLLHQARTIKPVMIVIASSANVFAGNENDRSQVQQFISMLTHLATVSHSAVVLISHPSLSGLQSDSGLSGSTAWYNSIRAQMYLKSVKDEKKIDQSPVGDQRVIEFRKNQYGPPTDSIVMCYDDGVFVLVVNTTADQAERNQLAEDVYLDVLLLLTSQGQDPSVSKRTDTYVVTLIYNHPSVAKHELLKEELEKAQQRLLDADRIHISEEGPASRRRKYIRPGPKPKVDDEAM